MEGSRLGETGARTPVRARQSGAKSRRLTESVYRRSEDDTVGHEVGQDAGHSLDEACVRLAFELAQNGSDSVGATSSGLAPRTVEPASDLIEHVGRDAELPPSSVEKEGVLLLEPRKPRVRLEFIDAVPSGHCADGGVEDRRGLEIELAESAWFGRG